MKPAYFEKFMLLFATVEPIATIPQIYRFATMIPWVSPPDIIILYAHFPLLSGLPMAYKMDKPLDHVWLALGDAFKA